MSLYFSSCFHVSVCLSIDENETLLSDKLMKRRKNRNIHQYAWVGPGNFHTSQVSQVVKPEKEQILYDQICFPSSSLEMVTNCT